MGAMIAGILTAVILAGIIGMFIGAVYLVRFLAEHNIFVTIVQEGQAKAIKRWGTFHRFVMAYHSYSFDNDWNVRKEDALGISYERDEKGEIIKDDLGDPKVIPLIKQRLLPGGIRWVGIPFIYTVHTYHFRWASFRQSEKDGELHEVVDARDELIDFVLLQDDVYVTSLERAETKDKVQVNVDLLVPVRIVNPYKALFVAEEWLEITINRLKPAVRSFVNGMEYTDLLAKRERTDTDTDAFLETTRVDEYIERNYGVRIKAVGFHNVEPAGEAAKQFVEGAAKQWAAEREKESVAALADAEVGRINKVFAAIREHGSEGLAIRLMESIDRAGEKQGNWVIPFGGLENIVQQFIGKGQAKP